MSVVSDIEIRLRADIARLQQDMTQARQAVGGAMSSISNAVSGAAKALGALAGAAAVGAFAGWIKGAIDATDAIGDISPMTGVATKDIAGLQMAFQFGGLEASAFESTMIKLSTAIAKDDEALVRLGIRTKTTTNEVRASKDVLYDLADAFEKMEDGTAKTALAIDVFGKTGASLIPMLSDGSEGLRVMAERAEKLGLTFDEETVEAAGKFNDTLDTMGLASQGIARQMAAQLLPTLNAVGGSFLDLIYKGDGVRKMSDVIGTGFKLIYTGALAVGQVFDTLSSLIAITVGTVLDSFSTMSKTIKLFIEGEYSAAWEAAQAGVQKTVNSVKNLGGDMVKSWQNSATAIGDAWSGKGAKVMDQMNVIGKSSASVTDGIAKDAEKAANAAAKAAQKMADEYAKMVQAIEDRISATQREVDGLEPLTEAQKLHRDLDRQLLSGKLELTAAQTRNYRSLIDGLAANEATIEANRKAAEATKEQAKAEKELADERERANQANIAEQKRQWEAIEQTAHDTFISIADGGKSAAQRLKDTFKNVLFDWLYQQTLKKWIIQLEGRATTSSEGGGLGDLFSDSSSGSGGTDWAAIGQKIYGGFSGKASAAGSSGSGGAGAMGGASSTAMAWLAAAKIGIAIGNKVSDGYSVAGEGKSKGFINLSTLTNSVPILGGLVGGIINRAFGRRDKQYSDSTVTGSLGSGGIVGGEVSSSWTQKGGWFKSDRAGKQVDAITQEMSSALIDGFEEIKASVTDYAMAFGLSADMLSSYTKTLNVTLTKDAKQNEQLIADLFSSISEEMAARLVPNIAEFKAEGESASATLERLAVNFKVVDAVLDGFGLTSQQTFGAVGVASIAARERLLGLVGGIEGLATKATFFADNFLTAEQRLAPVQARVVEQLSKLGYSGLTTTEQFAAAVTNLAKSGAVATKAGAETYAGLLELAPSFKMVADAATAAADQITAKATEIAKAAADERRTLQDELDELTMTSAQLLDKQRNALYESNRGLFDYIQGIKAQQAATNQAAADLVTAAKNIEDARVKKIADAKTTAAELISAADEAFAVLQRVVAEEKASAAEAHKLAMDRLQVEIEAETKAHNARKTATSNAVAGYKALSDAINSALFQAKMAGNEAQERISAQAQVQAAIAIARAGGGLPSADSLKGALSALSQDSSDLFSTMQDYQRDFYQTQNSLRDLGALSDAALTVEEKTLSELEEQTGFFAKQKEDAELAYAAQIRGLDNILANSQKQIDVLKGLDTTGLTIVQAVEGVRLAIIAAQQNELASSTAIINQAYKDALGRAPEKAGMEFWQDKIAGGTPVASVVGAITNSLEADIQSMYKSLLGRSADAEGLKFFMNSGASLNDIATALVASEEYKRKQVPGANVAYMSGSSQQQVELVAEVRRLNDNVAYLQTSMDATAKNTGQFADQFDAVSAGGNSLYVETAPA